MNEWESVLEHAESVRKYFTNLSDDAYRYHSPAMLSLDYIIALAVSRLTPHTADAACAQAGEVDSETRGAADV